MPDPVPIAAELPQYPPVGMGVAADQIDHVTQNAWRSVTIINLTATTAWMPIVVLLIYWSELLPFVKYLFANVKIVPIGVPPAMDSLRIGEAVAEIASELGLKIKVLGSTDLTHYGSNYGFVSKGTGPSAVDWVRNTNDRRVIDVMLDMKPDNVINEARASQNACCAGAASTAIACANFMGATRAESIAYATSYDKSPGDSFVGYVGIVFG